MKKWKLNVEKNFTDKYDKTKHYKMGDVIEVIEDRAKELLDDIRGLVSINEKPKDDKKQNKKEVIEDENNIDEILNNNEENEN